jgi:hypothetical protein
LQQNADLAHRLAADDDGDSRRAAVATTSGRETLRKLGVIGLDCGRAARGAGASPANRTGPLPYRRCMLILILTTNSITIGGRNHAILLIALLPLNAGRTIPAGVAVFSPKWIAPQAHGITVGLVRPQR